MFHEFRSIVFIGILASSFLPFTTAASDAYSCSASEHKSGWLMLSAQCDIGKGLWGQEPSASTGDFWVQCNYNKVIPAKTFSAKITHRFPHQSFLVLDKKRYRCLIGPASSYEQATHIQQELNQLGVARSFIRQTTTPISIDKRSELTSTKATIIPKKEKKKPHDGTPDQLHSLIENRIVLNAAIYSFTFQNLNYYQPRNIQSTSDIPPAFVKENNQYWSRVNIEDANLWCKRYRLRLPSFEELTQLQTYGQRFLLRNHWPIEMNYWSDSISNYSGEIKTLNLRSGRADEYRPLALLYTTCVNDAG